MYEPAALPCFREPIVHVCRTPRADSGGRHDAVAVVRDMADWPTGVRELLAPGFPLPARRTAHRREAGATGTHYSPLMAEGRRWDSPDEARLCVLGDVSPTWRGYWCQALVVRYEHEDKPRVAYPDFLVRLAGGGFVVLEVKPVRTRQREQERLAAVERRCGALGVDYRVVTDEWLRREPRLGNAARLHAAWGVEVDDATIRHVMDAVERERPTTLGDLMASRSMRGVQQRTALACALRGAFRIDIENGTLGASSCIGAAVAGTTRMLFGGARRQAVSMTSRAGIAGEG